MLIVCPDKPKGDVEQYVIVILSFKRHRHYPAVIWQADWLCHRFSLSLGDVEEVLPEKGMDAFCEAIRNWCRKFARQIADSMKRKRSPPSPRWHLDGMFSRKGTCGRLKHVQSTAAPGQPGRHERASKSCAARMAARPSHDRRRGLFFATAPGKHGNIPCSRYPPLPRSVLERGTT